MTLVLGIDLGTQNLKALVYDPDAQEVRALTAAPLELHQRDDGTAEQEAKWWVDALHSAMSQIDPTIRAEVEAVAVSGQQHGFVPVGADGGVLAPVKLWCDTSTAAECDLIMDRVGGIDSCIGLAGNPILPGYTASKVLWLKHTHPALYAAMDCILLPHDYLNLYLTGERCMEMGDASGTGFFNVRRREWSREVLQAIDSDRDLCDCLPKLETENVAVGAVRRDVAEQLGMQPGIPVCIGGGDNMMGAIGTGNVRPGRLTMSLGTSGTVYSYSDQPVVDPKGEIAAFCSSTGGWLPLLCTMNCTVSTKVARTLVRANIQDFESQIVEAPIGSKGILTMPFFNGERTPNLPRAKGCFVGLDSDNAHPENLMRSSVEGASFALKHGIDRLAELGIVSEEVVLTGGGSKSPTWRQIIADVCNSRVLVLEQQEGAAFGAALQALEILSGESLESLANTHIKLKPEACCEPEPAAVSAYRQVYEHYQAAVKTITPLYKNGIRGGNGNE